MQKSKKNSKSSAPRAQQSDKKSGAYINSSQLKVTTKPRVTKTREGFRIRHREYIGDINGYNAFSDGVRKFITNPGLMAPWLAGQAAGWEQYRYHLLRFDLIKRRPTTSAGSVMIVMDYNPYDALPSSEQQMSSFSGCKEESIYETISYSIDIRAFHGGSPRKFVRDGLAPPGDLRSYDGGNLIIATTGASDPGTLSHKLWVEYDVEFFVPETEGRPLAVGYLNSRSSEDVSINTTSNEMSAWTPVPVNQIQVNGIEAKLSADGKLVVPRGIYRFIANTSIRGFNGTGPSNHLDCVTRTRVNVNGVGTAPSSSAARIPTESSSTDSQLENTTQGILVVDTDTGEVLPEVSVADTSGTVPTVWTIPMFAATLALTYLGRPAEPDPLGPD